MFWVDTLYLGTWSLDFLVYDPKQGAGAVMNPGAEPIKASERTRFGIQESCKSEESRLLRGMEWETCKNGSCSGNPSGARTHVKEGPIPKKQVKECFVQLSTTLIYFFWSGTIFGLLPNSPDQTKETRRRGS